MEEVCKFLQEAGVYFIATEDGDQPRVRPFGTSNIINGKLYIQSGKGKKVVQQIAANPKVEICAMKGGEWIRISCTLVEDDSYESQEAMLDANPNLRDRYTSGPDGNNIVFYMTDATATIEAFTHEPVEYKF